MIQGIMLIDVNVHYRFLLKIHLAAAKSIPTTIMYCELSLQSRV
jgi:hypothetical protein